MDLEHPAGKLDVKSHEAHVVARQPTTVRRSQKKVDSKLVTQPRRTTWRANESHVTGLRQFRMAKFRIPAP